MTVALLAVAALWHVRWRPRGLEPIGLRIIRHAVGIGSLTLALAVVALATIGPWEITPFGVTISVSRLPNIVAQGMLFWAFSIVLSPAGAWAYRRHSSFAFYLLAAFVLGVLALGPEPKLLGHDFMTHSAYKALTPLPGYEALRVPARFWMLTTICLSTVAGLAFARLVPATSRRRPLALAFVTVGVLADGWVLFPTVTAPTRSPSLDLAKGTVLELPLGTRDQDAAAMLRSSYHGQALVNGYSAYPPRHYRALAYGLERGNDDVLDLLSQYGVRFVRIDRSHTAAPQYEQYVGAQPGARLVRKDARAILYELTMSRTVAASPTLGEPLKIAGVSANVAGDTVERAIDGSRLSRWETGPQRPGHAFSVDLATAQPLGAVTLQLGPFATDFPRELTVELSVDGRWQEVWNGPTDVLALAGALREPLDIPMVISLGGRVAKRVRLRSTSSDPEFSWSIADVSVLGPASASSG